MARKTKATKKGNTVTLDFSDISSNVLLPEGDGYVFKVLSASDQDNDGDGSIAVKVEVIDGPSTKVIGKETTFYFNKGASSLWVLANFLAAVGVDAPKEEFELDLDDLADQTFGASIEHNEYKGNTKARPKNFMPADEIEEAEEEEEVEVKKPSKKAKAEDEAPAKGKKAKASKKVVDEEEEEEEEEEAPAKKSSKKDKAKDKKAKKVQKYSEDEVKDMDEDELEELVEAAGLDIDLDDFPTLRKKTNAVLDALEEAELIED